MCQEQKHKLLQALPLLSELCYNLSSKISSAAPSVLLLIRLFKQLLFFSSVFVFGFEREFSQTGYLAIIQKTMTKRRIKYNNIDKRERRFSNEADICMNKMYGNNLYWIIVRNRTALHSQTDVHLLYCSGKQRDAHERDKELTLYSEAFLCCAAAGLRLSTCPSVLLGFGSLCWSNCCYINR